MSDADTGTEALRATLTERIRKGQAATIARDLDIGAAALDSFSRGEGSLPPRVLDALAKHLFHRTKPGQAATLKPGRSSTVD